MYQFKFITNENDYLEFQKYYALNAPAFKKSLRNIRLMGPMMFSILFLVIAISDENINYKIGAFIFLALSSIVFYFICKPLFKKFLGSTIKRVKKDGKMPYGKDCFMQFYDDIFIDTSIGNDIEIITKSKYKNIEKIDANENAFYIFINAVEAFIIPFTAFESEAQRNEFCAFIENKIAK